MRLPSAFIKYLLCAGTYALFSFACAPIAEDRPGYSQGLPQPTLSSQLCSSGLLGAPCSWPLVGRDSFTLLCVGFRALKGKTVVFTSGWVNRAD